MKKSLLALAAMGAFAGAAQAQSSVTVYGILDVGYGSANQRVANQSVPAGYGIATGGNNSSAVVNNNSSGFGGSYLSTSRLGFRGTEDLGGGLSGFFTIETSVDPNGNAGVFGTSGTGNRQTFVGLAKKGIGQTAIGTQYTVIHNAASATDPGQLNNMMGNVIYDKQIAVASSLRAGTTQSSGTYTLGSNAFAGNQDNTSYTVRTNNTLTIRTDNFGGFVGSAFYTANSSTTNAGTVAAGSSGYTGGVSDNTGWGIGGNFTWQKLLVTANYQSFTSKQPYTQSNTGNQLVTAGSAALAGYYGGSSVAGTNVRDNQQYYAITYDFGILKAYAQYVARKVMPSQGVDTSNAILNRTAQQIGVRSNITKTIEGWASVGNGRVNYFDTNYANIFGYQLGSNYWLSKRTNLYAIYGAQSTSNAVIGSNNPTSYNASSYALGVRHTF